MQKYLGVLHFPFTSITHAARVLLPLTLHEAFVLQNLLRFGIEITKISNINCLT